MKHKYPSKYEIYEALMMTTSSFTNRFAQRLGIFITNSSHKEVASEISKLFLEEDDIESIRLESYQQKINHSLSGFEIKSSKKDFSLVKSFNSIIENKLFKQGIILDSLKKELDSEIYRGSYTYTKKKPGRIELLQDETNSFEFYIKKEQEGEWSIEIDSTKSTDLKELRELFELGIDREDKIELLDEKLLSTPNSIKFFDSLAKYGLKENWRLGQILHISIKNNDEESVDVDDNTLEGISQAIIEGRNLRGNSFIENAVASGFSFSSMTYEFENTKQAYVFQIKAEFKGRPKVFEVSVEKYFEKIGKEEVRHEHALTKKQHLELRSKFWNFSKAVFNNVINRKSL